jgi:biotin operon repressor
VGAEEGARVTRRRREVDELVEQTRDAERDTVDYDKLRRRCLRRASSLEDLASLLKVSQGAVLDALHELKRRGVNVREVEGAGWLVDKTPLQTRPNDPRFSWESDDDGWFRFGLISDQHYGSKFCREDVAEELYDWFASEGVGRVYNAGNWIDGEGHANRMDLLPEAHGMQRQLDYCAARWPHKPGIQTFHVSGDDHEGWYVQRENVNIGRMLDDARREAGHDDLTHLGYVEAYVRLRRPDSEATSSMLVQHPGGGSSYAYSYKPQKLVESLQSGEKPGFYVAGHYHKINYFQVRGVHTVMPGSCKEQDTWMRKKGLDSQLGGAIIEMRMDHKGAIGEFIPRFKVYRDRRYYANGFDPGGDAGPRVEV